MVVVLAVLARFDYSEGAFWVAVATFVLVATSIAVPVWRAQTRNWKVQYSLMPYASNEDRLTKRWRMPPGYHTVLLRVRAPAETDIEAADVSVVNRRRWRRWKWQYAPVDKIQVLEVLTRPEMLPTFQHQNNRPAPMFDSARFRMGDLPGMGKGESKWFYVTLFAQAPWDGRLSFRARLAGTRRQARLSLAITALQANRVVRATRWITHGSIRVGIQPIAVHEQALRPLSDAGAQVASEAEQQGGEGEGEQGKE